jgi:hypothetical protein
VASDAVSCDTGNCMIDSNGVRMTPVSFDFVAIWHCLAEGELYPREDWSRFVDLPGFGSAFRGFAAVWSGGEDWIEHRKDSDRTASLSISSLPVTKL